MIEWVSLLQAWVTVMLVSGFMGIIIGLTMDMDGKEYLPYERLFERGNHIGFVYLCKILVVVVIFPLVVTVMYVELVARAAPDVLDWLTSRGGE